MKSLTAGVGTTSNFGAVVKTPESSHNEGANTNTTLILETCAIASTNEKDGACVTNVAYDVPGSVDRPRRTIRY